MDKILARRQPREISNESGPTYLHRWFQKQVMELLCQRSQGSDNLRPYKVIGCFVRRSVGWLVGWLVALFHTTNTLLVQASGLFQVKMKLSWLWYDFAIGLWLQLSEWLGHLLLPPVIHPSCQQSNNGFFSKPLLYQQQNTRRRPPLSTCLHRLFVRILVAVAQRDGSTVPRTIRSHD